MSQWSNWSGSVRCAPAVRRAPASLAEIVDAVREAGRLGGGLRVVGAGHSFTPLAATAGTQLSLDRYAGLVSVDRAGLRARVRAGTRLRDLGALLAAEGLAQENLGDIDAQSIAGATSTGTHGTGLTLGNLSTQIVGLTLVTAEGEVLECSAERDPQIFTAARIGLGALGVIAELELRLLPAYRLDLSWRPEPLAAVLADLPARLAAHRAFEFHWLPYSGVALTKTLDATDAPADASNLLRAANELLLENGGLWLFSELCRLYPPVAPRVSRLMSGLVSTGRAVDASHRIYATPRLVRFQEMEYALPIANFAAAVQAIDACTRASGFHVHFPLECRFVRGDDIPLSPAYGRDTAYIAVHMYRGMPYRAYFRAMEAILRSYGGRPHWGKMHSLGARDLAPLYPRWAEFQAVRRGLDPRGRLLNPYLRHLLEDGAPGPASGATIGQDTMPGSAAPPR